MTVDVTGTPTDLLPGAPAEPTETPDSPESPDSPGSPEPREPAKPSLSPSRAADFKTCPLLYRLRSIDRLPEQPTADQARGTLVHAVLERLFDLEPMERTADRAAELIEPEWARLVGEHPDLAGIFPPPTEPTAAPPADPAAPDPAAADPAAEPAATDVGSGVGTGVGTGVGQGPVAAVTMAPAEFLASTRDLLGGYFAVEDPRRLAPAEREYLVTTEIDEGRLVLRGYIDRLDESPTGDLRVVDYKTGGAPREAFEARALFQLKFYALVLWRTRGVVPRVLRLLYLRDAEICDYSPDTEELARFERTLIALRAAIERAIETRDFRPKPSRLCGWCAHQALCPAFGGTPPPFPELDPAPRPEAAGDGTDGQSLMDE